MIPLLAPGATRHSSSSSKSLYLVLVMMSTWSDLSQPATVFSDPLSTTQHFSGNASRRKPRQAATDLPSNRICHFGLAAATRESRVIRSNPYVSKMDFRNIFKLGPAFRGIVETMNGDWDPLALLPLLKSNLRRCV